MLTAAITLTLFYLMDQPAIYKRLQEELDAAFAGREFDPAELSKAPLLNAVVNEVRRLQPSFISSLTRCRSLFDCFLLFLLVPRYVLKSAR
jgi:cytochrome P450